ncbi:MAG: hypothetical protein PWQ75_1329 [Methanolobus sp.]|uniref:hypothetical protein n=1 Tax=Methanolobus sp. TaxID=1874737 RepID=UPI00258BBB6B|nr:hypothetical protein [Methanolobus sp.]MDK2831577.1 hypothetical protein [Methanolobus sp.]
MKQKSDIAAKTESSVEILKDHIEEISVKCLDNNWIQDNKIDLNSLMADNHSNKHFKPSSGLFNNNVD